MLTDAKLLKSRVTKYEIKSRLRQKKMYQLAKELGFLGCEAVVLQNWSEARIRKLAESKKNNT